MRSYDVRTPRGLPLVSCHTYHWKDILALARSKATQVMAGSSAEAARVRLRLCVALVTARGPCTRITGAGASSFVTCAVK